MPFSHSGNKFYFIFLGGGAAPAACGVSQARGLIGAVAAGLATATATWDPRHLQPTPRLMAMQDPYPTDGGQGSNPQPHGS